MTDVPDYSEVVAVQALQELDPPFARVLRDEFDLAGLTGHLCPVLLADGSAALLAQARYVRGAWADEMLRQLRARGYILAHPARIQVEAALLLSLLSDAASQPRARLLDRPTLALLFEDIVRAGLNAGASDIHLNALEPGPAQVRYSIDGRYVALPGLSTLARATLLDMLAVVWMDVAGGNGAVFDPRIEQQGRIACRIDGCDLVLRWASLATDHGPSVCLRLLQAEEGGRSLTRLGFEAQQARLLRQAADLEGGAIVVAGRVGSGKSTTLATLLRGLAVTRKIITLEDPVEFRIAHALQNTVGRGLESGHEGAFDAKLKTLKRSAMNDVYLGEVRDRETGRAFMDLAGCGVSVYTTVHAGSVAAIAVRLASDFIGVPADFLACEGVLKLRVYQELLPCPCPGCAWPVQALLHGAQASAWNRWLQALPQVLRQGLRLRNARGCARCRQGPPALHGYAGRRVAAELLPGSAGAPPDGWQCSLARKACRGELDARQWVARAGGRQALLGRLARIEEALHG